MTQKPSTHFKVPIYRKNNQWYCWSKQVTRIKHGLESSKTSNFT